MKRGISLNNVVVGENMSDDLNKCIESIKNILRSIKDIEVVKEPSIFECSIQSDLTLLCSKHIENPAYKVVDLVIKDDEGIERRLMLFIGGDTEDLRQYVKAIEKIEIRSMKLVFNKFIVDLIKNNKCNKLYPVLVDMNIVIGGGEV